MAGESVGSHHWYATLLLLGIQVVDVLRCTYVCTIHNTKGSPLTPDGCASPHCCLLHLGNDAIEPVNAHVVLPTVTMI